MSAELDVLVAGELNPDAIVAAGAVQPRFGQVETLVDDGVLTVGSSGAIFACGAARLGLATAYAGLVGDDAGGRFMLDELRRRGVDVAACRVEPGQRTGLTVVLAAAEDRAILTFPGAMSALRGEDVGDELLRRARHLHVSSPHLQPRLREGLAALFGRARAAGLSTSLDPGWDPGGGLGRGARGGARADRHLPAQRRGGLPLRRRRRSRRRRSPSSPPAAPRWSSSSARRARSPPAPRAGRGSRLPAVATVDATGAGDSFAAGFLAAAATGCHWSAACGSPSPAARWRRGRSAASTGSRPVDEANEFERSFT